MNENTPQNEIGSGHFPQLNNAANDSVNNSPGDDVAAWVMIENGRYQPQRIKGSCLGRELG